MKSNAHVYRIENYFRQKWSYDNCFRGLQLKIDRRRPKPSKPYLFAIWASPWGKRIAPFLESGHRRNELTVRFVRLRGTGPSHLGVAFDDFILDISAPASTALRPGLPTEMREVFDREKRASVEALLAHVRDRDDLRQQLLSLGALVPSAAADLDAPIDDPALLLAVGMNYHDHLRELNASAPGNPYAFTKSVASIIGPRDSIVLPPSNAGMVDLEGELVIVIGHPCYRVSEADAARFIGGYTIANDVSARDWVAGAFRETALTDVVGAWGLNLLGKQFPTFCPLGPFLVSSEHVPDVSKLEIVSRVNGEVFQSSNTSEMIFTPAQIVAYFSQFYEFAPGDLILTGTPAGVGFSREPKRFFRPGDVVTVEIESLGTLHNPVSGIEKRGLPVQRPD